MSHAPPESADYDALELQLAVGEIRAVLAALEQVSEPQQLAAQGPPKLELRLLAGGPGAVRQSPLGGQRRGAYALVGEHPGVEVWPAFAAALTSDVDLRVAFPDIWALDLELWHAMAEPSSKLLMLWLRSPGRRLSWQLAALSHEVRGAADFSLSRLHRAAGVHALDDNDIEPVRSWFAAQPDGWQSLHSGVLGNAIALWGNPEADPVRAMRDLDNQEDPLRRAAAIGWLMRRVVDNPFYRNGGLHEDLRAELPGRLTENLARPTESELDDVLLQHAAFLTQLDNAPGALFRTWGVARWLRGCLLRSPFFGGDPLSLTVRLQALLPKQHPIEVHSVLHPRNFFGTERLPLEEMAIASALHHHYQSASPVKPVPVPVSDWLRGVAGRCLTTAEFRAESLPSQGQPNTPQMLARQVLSAQNISWMVEAEAAAIRQLFDFLSRRPEQYAWVGQAVLTEGPKFEPWLRDLVVRVLTKTRHNLPIKERLLFAAGLYHELPDDLAAEAVELAVRQVEPPWRGWLLSAFAERAEEAAMVGRRDQVLAGLIEVTQDSSLDDKPRLDAGLLLARRARSLEGEARDRWLAELNNAMKSPPLSTHLGLRRELTRLGLPPTNRRRGAP